MLLIQLIKMDVSHNEDLHYLSCWNNWLDFVDIGCCTMLVDAVQSEPPIAFDSSMLYQMELHDPYNYIEMEEANYIQMIDDDDCAQVWIDSSTSLLINQEVFYAP